MITTFMKAAPILAIMLLLSPWVSAQEEHEHINDAPLRYLHIRTKSTVKGVDDTSDRYFRCDKVTSVTLKSFNVSGTEHYQIRIATQELEQFGTEKGGPVVVNLWMQSKEEAERKMHEIMQWIERKA